MKGLSVKAGLDPSTVHAYLARGRAPTVEHFLAISKAAGISPGWLLEGDERADIGVPVVGIVSAGEGWHPVDDPQIGQVTFELSGYDTIALEVRGDSMFPVYRDRDYLICHRQHGANADNLIGRDCVLRLADGRCFVKILNRGSMPGRFTLRSYNASVPDVQDVALSWVAPVSWIKRH